MLVTELLLAGVALLAALVTGTVAHELSHAAVLRAAGVPCDVEWLPDDDEGVDGVLAAGVRGRLATVTPRAVPDGTASWHLRLAAVAPLALLVPLAPVGTGALPDPFATGPLALRLAVVGWVACALPSPQDFSWLWYAGRVRSADASTPDADRAEVPGR